jgi:hypothetical protein
MTGPVFGYRDYFHGLGIMMDTYSNLDRTENVRRLISIVHNRI